MFEIALSSIKFLFIKFYFFPGMFQPSIQIYAIFLFIIQLLQEFLELSSLRVHFLHAQPMLVKDLFTLSHNLAMVVSQLSESFVFSIQFYNLLFGSLHLGCVADLGISALFLVGFCEFVNL
jgi:hypothetical protein